MWKKLLWIVVILYPVSVVLMIVANSGTDATIASVVLSFLFLLVPLGVLIFELRDGKLTNFWGKLTLSILYLISFGLLGVGTAGYYTFNTPTPINLIKGLPLLMVLLALFYFAFKRLFRRNAAV